MRSSFSLRRTAGVKGLMGAASGFVSVTGAGGVMGDTRSGLVLFLQSQEFRFEKTEAAPISSMRMRA